MRRFFTYYLLLLLQSLFAQEVQKDSLFTEHKSACWRFYVSTGINYNVHTLLGLKELVDADIRMSRNPSDYANLQEDLTVAFLSWNLDADFTYKNFLIKTNFPYFLWSLTPPLIMVNKGRILPINLYYGYSNRNKNKPYFFSILWRSWIGSFYLNVLNGIITKNDQLPWTYYFSSSPADVVVKGDEFGRISIYLEFGYKINKNIFVETCIAQYGFTDYYPSRYSPGGRYLGSMVPRITVFGFKSTFVLNFKK